MGNLRFAQLRFAQLELRLLREEEEEMPWKDQSKQPDLFARWGLSNAPQECIWVVAYDPLMQIRTVVEVGRGSHRQVDLHIPTLLAAVITAGCERFHVVHNHTSGDPKPSVSDFELTANVAQAAAACGLFFEDHWIVTPRPQRSYSFLAAGYLRRDDYVGIAQAAGV